MIDDAVKIAFYNHVHIEGNGKREPRWRGTRVVKFPTDLILYAQTIFDLKPDFIIETGTRFGGASQFFGDMLTLGGGSGRVISIDVKDWGAPAHPKVEYVIGSSADRAVVAETAAKVAGAKVMVVLDSDHRRVHVQRELRLWSHVVTVGQFLVVEDCYTRNVEPYWPGQAVEWFLRRAKNFQRQAVEDQFLFAVSRGGWLKRLA